MFKSHKRWIAAATLIGLFSFGTVQAQGPDRVTAAINAPATALRESITRAPDRQMLATKQAAPQKPTKKPMGVGKKIGIIAAVTGVLIGATLAVIWLVLSLGPA